MEEQIAVEAVKTEKVKSYVASLCFGGSVFADRRERAAGLEVHRAATGEEKHIGHHLFITLTPSVHCQGDQSEWGRGRMKMV
uniref:Uncharacterized protein n=1 Tax=Knipowitschia caucasica TaxID=637954 RepID=A0AAV2LIL2_KNICA